MTEHSQNSEWALKEIDYAKKEQKHVVLVRFNDDSLTKKFRFEFTRADIIDWRILEQREKLLGDLRRWAGKKGASVAENAHPNHTIPLWAKKETDPQCSPVPAIPNSIPSMEPSIITERKSHMKTLLHYIEKIIRWPTRLASVLGSSHVGTTHRLDLSHDTSAEVNELDSRDFSIAANRLINDLCSSGAVDKPGGGRYVLAIGRVANRTRQGIDVDQLVKKIRIALLRSGKVVVSTAVGACGAEDTMSRTVRDLANEGMFNATTVARSGTAIAPELSLSGKIIERNLRITNSQCRIEYFFQLSITDLATGLAFWEGEEIIGKIGSR